MKFKSGYIPHYSQLLTYDPPTLKICDEYTYYFKKVVKIEKNQEKTKFDLDIEMVIDGNIDEYNINALDALIFAKGKLAKEELNSQYEKSIAVIKERDDERQAEILRLTSKIIQLKNRLGEIENDRK